MNLADYQKLSVSEDDEGWWLEGKSDVAVMYKYEQEGITKGIDELYKIVPFTSVIELGFGAGYTADKFQELGVTEHIIIEAHPYFYKKAQNWAKNKTGVTIIYNAWQDTDIPEKKDLVYHDTYDMLDYKMNPMDKFDARLYGFCWGDLPIDAHAVVEEQPYDVNGETKYQPFIIGTQ